MIQINLVPGAKKVRGRSAAGAIGDYASAARAHVSDPFLTGAVAAVILAVAGVGGTYASHAAREASVGARQEVATADSARYAVMLRERASAVAQRDSVARQLQIIRTIDNDRFVWPHVLDEVSRALPPYTWLTTVEQTSVPAAAPPGGAAADSATGAAADSAARAAPPRAPRRSRSASSATRSTSRRSRGS
jgi:Tfp pilus assembly protein PilN